MFDSGPALILAGPGSGKTYVITHHINYLIKTGVSPDNILVITFTRKASIQMKERFKALSPYAYNRVTFGTFHSVFFNIIKKFSDKNLSIVSQEKREELIYSITGNRDLTELYSRLFSLKKSGDNHKISFTNTEEQDEFEKNFSLYQELLAKKGLCDFDDIILLCNDLLINNLEALEALNKRYKHILIDEFQDINLTQYEAVKRICGNSGIIYAVGDEDQSIYGFRGSSPQILRQFSIDYPDTRKITLVTNYRSRQSIVYMADRIIDKNTGRLKHTKQVCLEDERDCAGIKVFADEAGMFESVIRDIEAYDTNQSVAVLFRTNREVFDFNKKFASQGTDNIESCIKDMIYDSVVRYIDYMISKNGKNLLRILNCPERNIPSGIFDSSLSLEGNIRKFSGTGVSDTLSCLKTQLTILGRLNSFSFCVYLFDVIGLRKYIKSQYSSTYSEYIEETFKGVLEISKDSSDYVRLKESLLSKRTNKPNVKKTYDNLSVLTFHQSKGLEYDFVIIPNVIEGRIPSSLSVGGCTIEEERRLFYVACTRASKKLTIYTIKNEESGGSLPSRFISDFF